MNNILNCKDDPVLIINSIEKTYKFHCDGTNYPVTAQEVLDIITVLQLGKISIYFYEWEMIQ